MSEVSPTISGTWWNEDYGHRASIAVDNGGGQVQGGDIHVDVPATWDHFWDNIISGSALDVVVVDLADDEIVDFQRSGFDFANRTLAIEIYGETTTAESQHLWLYYGYSSEATDRSTSFTAAGAKSGYIELGAPAPDELVVVAHAHRDEDPPPERLVKRSGESVAVWVDLQHVLARRYEAYNRKLGLEAIVSTEVAVEQGGDPVGSMVASEDTRYVAGHLVYVPITGGTDGNNYTLIITITTTRKTWEERVLVQVRDPNED